MKKLALMGLGAMVCFMGLTACGGGNKEDEKESNPATVTKPTSVALSPEQQQNVAERIEKGQPLTDKEFLGVIRYVGEFAQKAAPFDGEEDYDNAGSKGAKEAAESIEKLKAEYPYYDIYAKYVENTPLDKLSKEDMELINAYAYYQSFNAPNGYTLPEPKPIVVDDQNDTITPVNP